MENTPRGSHGVWIDGRESQRGYSCCEPRPPTSIVRLGNEYTHPSRMKLFLQAHRCIFSVSWMTCPLLCDHRVHANVNANRRYLDRRADLSIFLLFFLPLLPRLECGHHQVWKLDELTPAPKTQRPCSRSPATKGPCSHQPHFFPPTVLPACNWHTSHMLLFWT